MNIKTSFILSLSLFFITPSLSFAEKITTSHLQDGETVTLSLSDQDTLFTLTESYDSVAVRGNTGAIILFSSDTGENWNVFNYNSDSKNDDNGFLYSDLFFLDKPSQSFQFRVKGTMNEDKIEFYFSKEETLATLSASSNEIPSFVPYPRDEWFFAEHNIVRREDWGANEAYRYEWGNPFVSSGSGSGSGTLSVAQKECNARYEAAPEDFTKEKVITSDSMGELEWAYQYSPEIKKIIVHHTADNNSIQAGKSGDEIMRSVYKYHANSRGWGDIGYNFVIAPNGTIYEGRAGGDYVIGGHAYCTNTQTIGVSLMGNFEDAQPTVEQAKALQKLLGGLSTKYDLDLSASSSFVGKETPNLVGHRDYGATACPGENLYAILPALRATIPYTPQTTQENISYTTDNNPNEDNEDYVSTEISEDGRSLNITARYTNNTDSRWEKNRVYLKAEIAGVKQFISLSQDIYPTESFTFEGSIQINPQATIGILTLTLVSANGENISEPTSLSISLENSAQTSENTITTPLIPQVTKPETQDQTSIIENTSSFSYPEIQNNTQLSTPSIPAPDTPIRIRLEHTSDMVQVRGNTMTVSLDSTAVVRKKSRAVITVINDQLFFDGEPVSVLRINNQSYSTPLKISSWSRPLEWDASKDDNLFLGTLEFRMINGELAIINELPLEDYVKGIAEVSNTAPLEKQKAIAVIARTYAQFYMDAQNEKYPGMPYHGDDSPESFQKYRGYGYTLRSPLFAEAVQDTQGQVVTYNGSLIKTPFFSESDGTTKSAESVWGWQNTPYLQSVNDVFCMQGAGTQKGHGVGLSGCGAQTLANLGYSYLDIISYYYTGVEVR